ncbi:MAG: cytidine deaminase [Tissierellia bacterium]|nr:cytidine deaminase [Tissierellia bacterium]
MKEKDLILQAKEAQKRAYVPYSGFPVGAAILTEKGEVYTGCNIENAAYTPTVCAERVAIFKAVSQGDTRVKALAVVGGDKEKAFPCGVCRQVLSEFGDGAKIIVARDEEDYEVYDFEDLLPHHFGPKDLGGQDV